VAVDMQDVLRVLDPEEPNYGAAAALGTDALPHLAALVDGDDPMLAAKAAYAASLLEGNAGQDVVAVAARHGDSAVRVAAAAAARNLPADDASAVLTDLVGDDEPGVRKVARASVPDTVSPELARRLDDAGGTTGPAVPADPSVPDTPMPGGGAMPGGRVGTGLMPGEQADTGLMPGEADRRSGPAPGRMPGEAG